MKNGSLYDNLHDKYNRVLSSWKMRIKIALDVCRGIQYLLNNTVAHVDKVIKSCNILFDGTWTARVSDFRLTFVKNKMRGVDCIHPKRKYANELTQERDVYALGVVMLELLTGRRPNYRYWDDRDTLLDMMGVGESVDWGFFLCEDLMKILDLKVRPPSNLNETRALHLVARTALELIKAIDRPTMSHAELKLEQALAFCEW
ncbi:putative serine/threonine-protein kinase-like protein CCR3 [Cajanus cajan]|nr:putative serine/threonine-protein kinase-like protein CCR3 [Cajanus cajan]